MDIPGYRIEHLIAEGGMAAVYLAVQESLDRRVALKVLKRFDSPAQSQRFLNEGRIIASLNHRNIITIYDIGVVGERHYICMEYLEGGGLEERIRSGMTPQSALLVAEAIGKCLAFVHGEGIVHRDIKPANILFRADGTPVLTDFGIAKQLEVDARLTMDGSAIGSPYYLSPEQGESKPLDGRSDIYGLGVILFEMLTGCKPFQGDSYIETIIAHITQPVPVLPRELEHYQDLLERMLAKDPEERFASADEMVSYLDDLQEVSAGLGQDPGRYAIRRIPARLQGRVGVVALVLGVTITVMLGAWMFGDEGGVGPRATASATGGGEVVSAAEAPEVTAESPPVEEALEQARAEFSAQAAADQAELASDDRIQAPADNEFYSKLPEPEPFDATPLSSAEPEPVDALRAPSAEPKPFDAVSVLSAEPEPSDVVSAPSTESARAAGGSGATEGVEVYLLKATQALDDLRLTIPEKDSAYFYYRQALALSPGHEQAVRGLGRIADRYADLAERKLEQGQYGEAERYVARGLQVDPGNPRLTRLAARSEAQRQPPETRSSEKQRTKPEGFFDRIRSMFKEGDIGPSREYIDY